MCTVSMIMDHYEDSWRRRFVQPPIEWPYTSPSVPPAPKMPTQAEIDEFRRLLERAREYDKRNGEPDCELEEKRQRIKDLAEKLGVKVEFV